MVKEQSTVDLTEVKRSLTVAAAEIQFGTAVYFLFGSPILGLLGVSIYQHLSSRDTRMNEDRWLTEAPKI